MVETLNTLWHVFLIVGIVFLIFVLVYTFIGTIYNLLIGNKKKEQARIKAKQELLENLQSLAEEIEKNACEQCKKSKKRTTKKSTKKRE